MRSSTASSSRRASSTSRSARSSIEPLRSAKSTVTCLRSPSRAPRESRIFSAMCVGVYSAGEAKRVSTAGAAAPAGSGRTSWRATLPRDRALDNHGRPPQSRGRPTKETSMANQIAAQGVHHFRLTVSNVDRAVKFYTEVLGFTKLMDLNPGAFLSNGSVGLGVGPHPFPDRAIKNDRFDENRIGLDHMSFAVPSRAALDDAVRVLDKHGVAHSEIRDLGEAFGISIVVFRDPDNVQLEVSGPRK